jgi:hypothetical protein
MEPLHRVQTATALAISAFVVAGLALRWSIPLLGTLFAIAWGLALWRWMDETARGRRRRV